jgi:hypothetical protein
MEDRLQQPGRQADTNHVEGIIIMKAERESHIHSRTQNNEIQSTKKKGRGI